MALQYKKTWERKMTVSGEKRAEESEDDEIEDEVDDDERQSTNNKRKKKAKNKKKTKKNKSQENTAPIQDKIMLRVRSACKIYNHCI